MRSLIYAIILQNKAKAGKLHMSEEYIIVDDTSSFDIRQILDCGQIFRYAALGDGEYVVHSKDKQLKVVQDKEKAVIYGDKEFARKFFDLDRDYGKIKKALASLPYMEESLRFGGGIRILNNDAWEMIISFIISANNHIPRIKGIIERLCAGLGKRMDGYYAFPTAEAMAGKDEDYYFSLGAGYRAPYLASTARAVAEGAFDVNAVYDMPTCEAAKYLCSLMGVGPKVADCILLFGYHRTDVFPVDTWIKKVYRDTLGGDATNKQMRQKLIGLYKELSGYAQQYLFFGKREEGRG